MITVAQTSPFIAQAAKLMSDAEYNELVDFLAANPEAGDIIPGTGGVRKLRYAGKGHGKRGGFRVVFYYCDETVPLYALAIYPKNAKSDITPDEAKTMKALVAIIKKGRA